MGTAKEAVAEVICQQIMPYDGVPITVEDLKIRKEDLAERGLWQAD